VLTDEQFRRVSQIGIVVKNIEKTRANWAKLLGVQEPPITETEDLETTHTTFRGKPSRARAKLAFFELENITLELIEPIGEPSTWQEFADRTGGGIHHVAFNVENLDGALENLGKAGIGIEQRGDYKGGCYVYVDSTSKLGGMIELLHSHRE
jgi:methylmalonyl-CoA/ethylmalonyl-CoA epimerase